MQPGGSRRKMCQIVNVCKKIQMNQKETLNGTVENHHLNLPVSFERCDDLVHLRQHLWAEDVERRVVKRDSPILGRALCHTYLGILCCCDIVIFHVSCLLIIWLWSAHSSRDFDEVVPDRETPVTDRCEALR